MKTIDKYERVANIARHARKDTSGYTIADACVKFQRIALRMRRLGTLIINGGIEREKGYAEMTRHLATAANLAKSLGAFTVDESDDGTGYLTIYHAKGSEHGIACFGEES